MIKNLVVSKIIITFVLLSRKNNGTVSETVAGGILQPGHNRNFPNWKL